MTLHDLIDDLTTYLNLTSEQQFRVTAKIKRYVHNEKHDLCRRLFLYSQGPVIFDKPYDPANPDAERKVIGREPAKDQWLSNVLKDKLDNHRIWAGYSDEDIVTWNIGTHKYK